MNKLYYPIVIETGDEDHAFGVIVPDLPGCFGAGDTCEEAFINAREAIESHLAILIEEGMEIPKPRPLSEHRANPDYQGWAWGIIDVRNIPAETPVRVNISLPEGLLEEIDAAASARHLTRSGFLAVAAREAIKT